MAHFSKYVICSVVLGFLLCIVPRTLAQEFSPRAYWPAPKGTMLGVSGYSYSLGDVVTDPSLPIVGVDSRISTFFLSYAQTLSLFGRTSNLVLEMPYLWGTTVGVLKGDTMRRDVSGIGDPGVTFSVNLLGAPSMSREEFQQLRNDPHQILGISLKILVPVGAYNTEKLINTGANRWAFRTQLGYMIPIQKKWLVEFQLGAWFFGNNDDFLGVTREQKPIIAAELNLVRRFKPGFWVALDLNYFTGGRTTIGDKLGADLQRNSRIGGAIVYPFFGRHSLKASFSMGTVTKSGNDFKTIMIIYRVLLN